MQQVFLTRRNLLTLLNKLDRNKKEGKRVSGCTLVKNDTRHPSYPCSDRISVTAVEDEEYYTEREPGRVHDADVPKMLGLHGAPIT